MMNDLGPKISIIVPVYNVEKFLPQCLDSIVNQTLNDIEIICINDGSKDESLGILQSYAEKDSRLVVIDKSNEGVSIARNVGLDIAKGEYIMFVDSDDWLHVETCETTYTAVIKHNADSIMFSYTKVFKEHSIVNHLFHKSELVLKGEDFKQYFFRRLIGPMGDELSTPQNMDLLVSPCMQLFKRELIGTKRFVDIRKVGTAEDLLFQLDVYKQCEQLVYIDKPYYFYRRSEVGTLTTKYIQDKHLKWKLLYQLIAEKAAISERADYKNALNNRIAVSCMGLGLNEVCAKDSVFVKSRRYKKILNESPYCEAIANLEINAMPFHWKVFFSFCKKRMTFLTVLMLECIEFLRTHKK